MPYSSISTDRLWWESSTPRGRSTRRWLLTFGMMILLLALCVIPSGCFLQRTEVLYVRLGPQPIETEGLLRVAQQRRVKVNVVGTGKVAKFDATGYILIHEQDWAAVARKLQERARK